MSEHTVRVYRRQRNVVWFEATRATLARDAEDLRRILSEIHDLRDGEVLLTQPANGDGPSPISVWEVQPDGAVMRLEEL